MHAKVGTIHPIISFELKLPAAPTEGSALRFDKRWGMRSLLRLKANRLILGLDRKSAKLNPKDKGINAYVQ